jgi:hypothetical protein
MRALAHWLVDPARFSALVLRMPLRHYQTTPLRTILHSVLHGRGREYLLVFPRQSGKNEAVAHLLAYLLNLYQRRGGNIVYGAIGDALGMGIERLEDRLDNAWNAGHWSRANKPTRRLLGDAAVVFLSSHPMAHARGQTAHHLLVIDEAQDQDAAHIEAVFTPMRAANNATALYIGTVKTTSDFLWTKKRELEAETLRDGHRRVFFVTPDQVTAEVPAYRDFLAAQVRKHGRHHPIVASEYYLEPIDAAGGLFPRRRRLLMRGSHPRADAPTADQTYIATLDVAGQDEATTDPIAQLANPARDYTIAYIFRVVWPAPGACTPGPTFEAVDVFVDHGSRHFETTTDDLPPLVEILAAWLQAWQVAHLVADESGVGQGLVSWLTAALGPGRVTGYDFAGRGRKASLGSRFLSLVETGRFRHWIDDEEEEGSAGWWFWRQVEACTYDLPRDGIFDRDLQWSVPEAHKTHTAGGLVPTHDDRLLAAALIAEADRLIRQGDLRVGRAQSAIIPPVDPLQETPTW